MLRRSLGRGLHVLLLISLLPLFSLVSAACFFVFMRLSRTRVPCPGQGGVAKEREHEAASHGGLMVVHDG